MSLFTRRTPLPPEPSDDAVQVAAMAGMVQRAKLTAYRDGLRDGILECLDQLEGTSRLAQGPAPELTPELREWIATVRANAKRA
jgi:hypothetical protein